VWIVVIVDGMRDAVRHVFSDISDIAGVPNESSPKPLRLRLPAVTLIGAGQFLVQGIRLIRATLRWFNGIIDLVSPRRLRRRSDTLVC
jgi:hypothetical protein